MNGWGPSVRFIVAGLIALFATLLYVIGLIATKSNPVEPQSVFTLYGAILGYLFGAHDKDERRENREVAQTEPKTPQSNDPTSHIVRGTDQG